MSAASNGYVTPGAGWSRVSLESTSIPSRSRELIKELRKLVAIPSVNPDHGAKNPAFVGEGRMAAALRDAFEEVGADEAWLDDSDTAPGRPNVYAIFKSNAPEVADRPGPKWLGIDDHIDTVTVENMPDSDEARFGAYVTQV